MVEFTFNKTKTIRKEILDNNRDCDFLFLPGNNKVLISVPHGISQTRLGKYKVAEIGTIPFGKILSDATESHLIVKTRNNFDDANFDKNCSYRQELKKLIKKYSIKYLIDIHGLAKWRDAEINLGTNLGNNIANDTKAFNRLLEQLKSKFSVSVDQPFMASANTISGYFARKFKVWTLQMEINCGITNYKESISKFNLLINILTEWINRL